MKWDLSFNIADTTRKYRRYHKSSSHDPLLQMKKSPRRDYEVKNLDTPNRPVKYKIDQSLFQEPMDKSFLEVLKQRRTSWVFSEKDLSELDFMKIMLYSFGISHEEHHKRTYPSGGQFYSVEIYILPTKRTLATQLLESKVYKYNVNSNEIVEMGFFPVEDLNRISASTDVGFFTLDQCQFVVILVGNDKDLSKKYLDLSYRIMLLEAGHMAQNFQLACTALDISSVPVGGFHESVIRKMLGLSENQMVLYTLLGG
ncbi:SagB/ThcOx family dehydrogenase [Bacillaceae bacterium Marseille-Q3522]|nr:SagB/ThcOx family dehydrogenase [Bacillaceae bacterium Marseille-Q3522]